MEFNYEDFYWSSDWNGDEAGYPEVNVVGLYTHKETGVDVYVDVENMHILEAWKFCDGCEEHMTMIDEEELHFECETCK